jgi:amidase
MTELPDQLVDASASALSRAMADRTVSCVEVVTAHLDRMDELESAHHALVSRRDPAEVIDEARARDQEVALGQVRGWLHGLPHAVKDLCDATGLPTTDGFLPVLEAPVAREDEVFVRHLREAGAVFVGKTNTPEFGLGSHTYNGLGPPTANSVDPSRSAGGSSGGAAVAVALGMVPVADGSDFMGSLRNPPGWNGVLGLRPTPGWVPTRDDSPFVKSGGVCGPIARDAEDLTKLFATMVGPHADSSQRQRLAVDADDAPLPRSIGWLGDLDGYLPMEDDVVSVARAALDPWRAAGSSVVDVRLVDGHGFCLADDLWRSWLTVRHHEVGGSLAPLHADDRLRVRMKPEARWEVEGYARLTVAELDRAVACRRGLLRCLLDLYAEHDVLALPTAQVWPFPVDEHWPQSIAGRRMDTYHRWMEVTTVATLAGLPVLVVPGGADHRGLPMGLQLMARPGADWQLLAWARRAQRARIFTVAAPTERAGAGRV